MKRIAKILAVAFVLNFFWEMGQAFLYAPHFLGIFDMIKVHLLASIGDVVLVCIILTLDIFIFSQQFSEKRLNWKRVALIMFFGFLISVAVEKYALAAGRWAYSDHMPIIPILNVGLTPILQMTLIPSLAFFIGPKGK